MSIDGGSKTGALKPPDYYKKPENVEGTDTIGSPPTFVEKPDPLIEHKEGSDKKEKTDGSVEGIF